MITLSTKDWKIENIDTILFDKDGTLIDSHIYWGEIIKRRAMALIYSTNISTTKYDELCLTMGLDINTGKLLPDGPIALVSREKVIEILIDYFDNNGAVVYPVDIATTFDKVHLIFNQEAYKYINLIQGSIEFVKAVKQQGVKTAIVTSDTVENTKAFLDYYNINNLFDCIVGKETTIQSKDTGVPAIYAIEELGSLFSNSISIGDAPIDIQMANNAFMKAGIGVATGQIKTEELKIHTNYVCNLLSEITIEVK